MPHLNKTILFSNQVSFLREGITITICFTSNTSSILFSAFLINADEKLYQMVEMCTVTNEDTLFSGRILDLFEIFQM